MEPILSVVDLKTQFTTRKGIVTAVDGVSFTIGKGEILCIVGESGCGKSTAALSVLQLLPLNSRIARGEILFGGKNLGKLSPNELSRIRGNELAAIFQDPMTSLNPTLSIGFQVTEPYIIHQGYTKKAAYEAAVEILRKVGIPSPERRMREYPHQLSGGMRQRVMIAMALACKPRLLIADEPTTALDVTIQSQILDLIYQLREETGTAILLITHDLGVVAEIADSVLVLYAGKSVEYGKADSIFNHPKHPYTQGLLKSVPRLDDDADTFYSIPGVVPNHSDLPAGCRYWPRCPLAKELCRKEQPGDFLVEDVRVNCFSCGGIK